MSAVASKIGLGSKCEWSNYDKYYDITLGVQKVYKTVSWETRVAYFVKNALNYTVQRKNYINEDSAKQITCLF